MKGCRPPRRRAGRGVMREQDGRACNDGGGGESTSENGGGHAKGECEGVRVAEELVPRCREPIGPRGECPAERGTIVERQQALLEIFDAYNMFLGPDR